MKQFFKNLIPVIIIALLIGIASYGATLLYPYQGGTGKDTSGWSGGCVNVTAGIWSTTTCGGGVSGSGQWSTTTGMIYYQDGVVVVGTNATSAGGLAFEVSGASLFDDITFSSSTNYDFAYTWATSAETLLNASSANWDLAYGWGDWGGNIDVSDDTNLTAGDYITITDDDLDVDAELTDYSFSISLYRASTTMRVQRQKEYAYTITEISCWSENGSTTIQFDERASTTPASGGTDVISSAWICTQNAMNSTSTFSNAAIAAGAILNLDIDARTGGDTVNTYIFVNAKVDD